MRSSVALRRLPLVVRVCMARDYAVPHCDAAVLIPDETGARRYCHTAAIATENLPVIRMSDRESISVILPHLAGRTRVALTNDTA